MNRLYLLFFALCPPMAAQFSSVAAHITYGSSIPAHCKPGTGDIFFKTTATLGPYYCSATDTWTFFGTAGGGGAVNGPGATTDSAVALWDGTSGTLLKNSSLLFDGTTLSGAPTISTGDGSAAGCATWKELAANGTNNRKWCSPDALTASLTFNWADALPTAGQVMAFSDGSGGTSNQTWATVLTAASVKTFTNTTYDTAGAGNSFSINSVAVTSNTGTGAVARATSPAFITPDLGTPSAGVATNITGLPIVGGTTGTLSVARGGTGTTTPSLVAGTNVTVTGTWPNQTVASTGGGGGATIPSTTNAIIGDGAGNGANSKIALTVPATGATITIPDGVTMTGPAASGTVMALNQTNTGTSAIKVDLNAATGSNAFRVPVKAFSGGEISANGVIAYNSTNDLFNVGRASGIETLPTVLAGTTITNNDCVNYNKSGTTITLTSTGFPCGSNVRAFGYSFDGGGSALTAGATGYLTLPYACTIAAWNISVDAGTATVDIWKLATGTAIPTISNTITASAIPAISTGTSIHSTTLTSWTTSVAANDIIGINLKVVATATFVNLTVQCNQ